MPGRQTKFKQVIVDDFVYLIEHMDPENGLLAVLFSKKIIDLRQMENIRKSKTYFDQNEELARLLIKKPDDDFKLFVEALDDTNQRHLAQRLQAAFEKCVLDEWLSATVCFCLLLSDDLYI